MCIVFNLFALLFNQIYSQKISQQFSFLPEILHNEEANVLKRRTVLSKRLKEIRDVEELGSTLNMGNTIENGLKFLKTCTTMLLLPVKNL